MKQTELKNLSLLLLTAMIWGAAFVAQSAGMDHVGPFTFLCTRSILGGLFLLPCIPLFDRLQGRHPSDQITGDRGTRPTLLFAGLCAGAVLMIASSFQQIGIQYTSVGKAGFLTAMYVIIVPFLGLALFRRRLEKRIWLCVFLSVFGMALLCLSGSLRLELGDGLELLCALGWYRSKLDRFLDGLKRAGLLEMERVRSGYLLRNRGLQLRCAGSVDRPAGGV